MYQPRYQQPTFRPTPSFSRRATSEAAAPVPVPPMPSPAPSPVQEAMPDSSTPGTALVPRVLTVDEVSAPVARRPELSGVAGLMAVPQPDSPRAAKRFAQTAEAIARGWSHLNHAAVAQANARNTAALSLQRAAEIGAAAQKACDEATLHRSTTLDAIAEISDRAELRAATQRERLETALLQARLDRQRARLELDSLTAKTAAESAQFRHVTAASELEATRLRITRAREEWQAAEDARLDALARDMRTRTFLADAALEHDRIVQQRADLRTRDRDTVATTPAAPAPAPSSADAVEQILEELGTTPARAELRTFLAPALHGVLECHPLAALVRSVYRSATALEGLAKLDAIREAARAALPFLEKPREQWSPDVIAATKRTLLDVEAKVAAKEQTDRRAALDVEDELFFGTDPLRARSR